MTAFSISAHAQEAPCGPHENMVAALMSNYGEETAALALTNDGKMLEVFVSPSGTWTIAIVEPDGTSCAVGAGDSWETINKKTKPEWHDS